MLFCEIATLYCENRTEHTDTLHGQNAEFLYDNPVRTSQETHYVSTTESSRLKLCKIWGFHGGDYEECRLLGYKNPVRTSQETHHISAIEPSRLKLCKIWGFHCGNYEDCRLLGYKTPVRTSQVTHDVYTTESSQLMLCKIWGFHGSDYEEFRLLGYNNPVRTSQETQHVSATEPNRLMLCGETVAVCCENRMEHTDTLCGQSVPHRKHITSPLQSPVG
jgi:hypothetical protein